MGMPLNFKGILNDLFIYLLLVRSQYNSESECMTRSIRELDFFFHFEFFLKKFEVPFEKNGFFQKKFYCINLIFFKTTLFIFL